MSKLTNLSAVPMPASKLYEAGGEHPESIRDRFVAAYGEATVQRAELQVVLDLFMIMGVVKPQEFIDVLHRKLERINRMRMEQAGVTRD
jgi:hypothetical protein